MNAAEKIVRLWEENPFARDAYDSAAAVAARLAFDFSGAILRRDQAAAVLAEFAAGVVPMLARVPDLSGLDRRLIVLWASRGLVEAVYLHLPKGPAILAAEAILGGVIRRTVARYLGDRVEQWLDAFVELEVAKLRKAAA